MSPPKACKRCNKTTKTNGQPLLIRKRDGLCKNCIAKTTHKQPPQPQNTRQEEHTLRGLQHFLTQRHNRQQPTNHRARRRALSQGGL